MEKQINSNSNFFRLFATKVANIVGTARAFFLAITIILFWLVSGPLFGFSNTWQLFINTMTTIVTFLMVFLIQNTQNRDSKAVHLKLDELIKGIRGARNTMVNLEELPDEEIEELQTQFRALHTKYQTEMDRRKKK